MWLYLLFYCHKYKGFKDRIHYFSEISLKSTHKIYLPYNQTLKHHKKSFILNNN